MSRLINADDFKKFLQALCEAGAPYEGVVQLLDKQPTAFDTEKVVEQLEKEGQKMSEAKPTKPYGKSSPSCHRYYKAISVKKSIDIVKKGGVE